MLVPRNCVAVHKSYSVLYRAQLSPPCAHDRFIVCTSVPSISSGELLTQSLKHMLWRHDDTAERVQKDSLTVSVGTKKKLSNFVSGKTEGNYMKS